MAADTQSCGRLYGNPQLDPIVRRMDQILPGSQIPFGGLHRRVTQQQLNLLKLPARGAAHFRATAPQVMGGNTGNTRRPRVWLEKLPDELIPRWRLHGSDRKGPCPTEIASSGNTGRTVRLHTALKYTKPESPSINELRNIHEGRQPEKWFELHRAY